jgi:iron complex outermembrane receptor protein
VKAQIQHKKLKVKLGAMRRAAENDFSFRDHSHPEKLIRRQQHANFEALDLMTSAYYAFNQKHAISIDFWGLKADRNIPGIMSVPNNSSQQKDESLKTNLGYYYFGKQSKFTFRTAYFTENLDFKDSLMQIDSKSEAVSLLNDFLYELQLKHQWKLSMNIFQGNYTANSTGYQGIRASQQRWVAMAAVEKLFLNNKLHVTARIRKEWLDGRELPYTPGFNMGYQFPKSWSINAGGAVSYRVPTFNDLYWLPGGNPNLNPEDGKHLQMNISKAAQLKAINLEVKTMLYRSEVINWIQWQPTFSTVWTPDNIKSVVNQGIEFYMKVSGKLQTWQWYFQGNAAIIKAEGQQNHLDNDQAKGEQLIYVPQHHANAQFGISRKSFSLMIYHQYTGLRYTASDHSQFLPAFQLSGIQVSQQIKGKRNVCHVFASCNNLFNTDYQVMVMRAMPGRNFQIGINYSLTPTPLQRRGTNHHTEKLNRI